LQKSIRCKRNLKRKKVCSLKKEVAEEIERIRATAKTTADFLKKLEPQEEANRNRERYSFLLKVSEDIDGLFIARLKEIKKKEEYRNIYYEVRQTDWFKAVHNSVGELGLDFRVWPLEAFVILLNARVGLRLSELQKGELIEILKRINSVKIESAPQ